jgi:hypothetical protein
MLGCLLVYSKCGVVLGCVYKNKQKAKDAHTAFNLEGKFGDLQLTQI